MSRRLGVVLVAVLTFIAGACGNRSGPPDSSPEQIAGITADVQERLRELPGVQAVDVRYENRLTLAHTVVIDYSVSKSDRQMVPVRLL